MACQTCDHTMQSITHGIFWCPRCGTLKFETGVPQWSSPTFLKTVAKNLRFYDDSCPPKEPLPMMIRPPLWEKVSFMFGLGSTASMELCRALDINPHTRQIS